jgi:DNA-binding CsgD family transcriptional regulator
VEALEQSPAALERARTLVELGAALRRAGRRRDARPPLRRGIELADGFGARAIARRGREELGATGARVPPRHARDRDELTPSELRVAMLAADGRSNKEIAQALFVTVEGVEWHLSHAYMKLGIRSRRELASALAERRA